MIWERMVKRWNGAAVRGEVGCDRKQCDGCGGVPEAFVCCELRIKTFLYVFAGQVYAFEAITLRYRCPLCKARFTMQPPWGLPRKRYVRGVILGRCWRYLRKAETTYRSLVGGTGYASGSEGEIKDRYPSHTRAWYWLKEFGEMEEAVRRVKALILGKNPSTEAVGRGVKIAACKYRSQERLGILETAYSLLGLRQEWFRQFRLAFPPVFGTLRS